MRLAFLTGAGASRGAGGITPYDPPLGFELYEYLRNEYPETWGSLPNNFHSLFRDNFEIGMAELWDAQLDIGSRLIIDMAVYFSRFDPPDDGMDCYSRLVWFLKTRNLIPRTAFATLNYECVLDVAATRHGLKVAYLSEEPPPGNLLIWKPHGACNLLPLDEIYNINVVAKQILEGPLRPVDLPEVRRRYAAGYSIPPAMSLFAPGKPTPVALSFVAETRRQWATWIKSASLVIIIGARPLLADNHIWDPLLTGSVEVWYVGGTADDQYRDFKSRMGERLIHIADRFPQGFGPLVRRLRNYVGS